MVRNKAIYLALGVLPDGTRDILGLWIENTEGAKFWMKVFNDLKTRGVADILIAVTDGLNGMPEALALAVAIKPIYAAPSAEAAVAELEAFAQGQVSYRGRRLASRLGPGNSFLCLPASNPPGDLYDQCH